MRVFVAQLLFFIYALATYAQTTYTARVVDAESGEPLPFVGVYASPEDTTQTNFDGEFSITAEADAPVRLTCASSPTAAAA